MNESPRTTPLITEIQRFCLQDGPGIRTTIFMKGCPLHCPWCHNPETQKTKLELYHYPNNCTLCGRCIEVCTEQANTIETAGDGKATLRLDRSRCTGCLKCVDACLSGARAGVGNRLTLEQILRESLSDQPFYKRSGGGVTLSGGDPLLFPEFSLEIATALKEKGVHVAMETSGFASWNKIEPLLNVIDLFLVDIKSLNPIRHKEVIGWPVEPILTNIEKLVAVDANVRIHIPIILGFNDSITDFQAFVEYLAPLATKLTGADVLPFHVYGESKYIFLGRGDTYQYKGTWNIPLRKVEDLARALAKVGILQVSIGGLVGMGSEKGEGPQEKEVLDNVKN